MSKFLNVTIVGGGFGGVKAALELAKQPEAKITLISDKADFQYYPALFATATGHDHRQAWVPLKAIFENHPNVQCSIDTIESIDPKTKVVKGKSSYHYEDVILALGSVTTYFGIEGLDTFAYGIKSQDEIRRLQTHLYNELSDGRDDEKNYVIIGAGPTGVELAGALGEYVRVLRKHFGIRKKRLNISLLEAAPRVLPRLSESSSRRAHKRLKKLGIHVEVNKKVEKQTADSLIVNAKALSTQTVIWTSGVANSPFYSANAKYFELSPRGKVKVNEFMQAQPHVYVIGDNAETPYAGLAQTALHDALFVTRHLKGSRKPYTSVLPASVIPIGHNWALFEWKWIKFGGMAGSIMRQAADVIGYHDVLPIGWALRAWRAQSREELTLPGALENKS